MWVRNPNQKSSASQWLNGSHHPPLAQTPFAALRSSREAGELSWVDFTRDDSQSEVFYYPWYAPIRPPKACRSSSDAALSFKPPWHSFQWQGQRAVSAFD
ncbi:unnamed protein product [Lactuca virosa]|uniref:Uncharacterized protein n=1 Tax=Lactuca virosa TaxID=75947 RepID=A0AAU9NKC4_9ASTR|nr:unnamed protein product [Lactuca virosa]